MVLVFSISNFFINKNSQGRKLSAKKYLLVVIQRTVLKTPKPTKKIDTCPCTSNLLDYSQCKHVSKGQKGHLFSIKLRGEKQHVVYKSKYSHSKQLRVPLVKTVYGKKLPERRRPK